MSIQILEEEGFTKFIVFTPEEHPSQGALPELKYKLIGLWKLNKSIVRAFFEAEEIPLENNESAFYRWEPVISSARSKHHYFYVPGAAGLSLKQNHLQKLVRSGDEAPTSLEDICGNFGPLSLQDLIESQS